MFLAFDLGGTRLKAGVVVDGTVEHVEIVELPEHAPAEEALRLLAETGRTLAGESRAAGVCVPGVVEEGIVMSLPGKLPGLVGRDLAAFLHSELGLRAVVSNDAIAYGIGESCVGAGRGHHRVVVMTIGTGVGVTVVQDERPLGSGPLGGGLLGGFIPIADDSPHPDSIGRHGTIESLCAAQLIAPSFASVPEAIDAHEAGDAVALREISAWRGRLARAIAALASAHAPTMVVVGGGPMATRGVLLHGVEKAVNDQLWPGFAVEVRGARLGDAAALVGLSVLAG
jgi:glucokinase